MQMPDLIGPLDISRELWREYDWGGRVYRISNPVSLYYRPGGTTHRVVDDDLIVHCVPAPGVMGCVLRWRNADTDKPVHF
jgi:hypothetical protein